VSDAYFNLNRRKRAARVFDVRVRCPTKKGSVLNAESGRGYLTRASDTLLISKVPRDTSP